MKEGAVNLTTALTSPTKSNGKWTAPKDIERLQKQMINAAKVAFAKLKSGTSRSLAQVNRRAVGFVRKHPMETAAGALALGFMVGALAHRRRSIGRI